MVKFSSRSTRRKIRAKPSVSSGPSQVHSNTRLFSKSKHEKGGKKYDSNGAGVSETPGK